MLQGRHCKKTAS